MHYSVKGGYSVKSSHIVTEDYPLCLIASREDSPYMDEKSPCCAQRTIGGHRRTVPMKVQSAFIRENVQGELVRRWGSCSFVTERLLSYFFLKPLSSSPRSTRRS